MRKTLNPETRRDANSCPKIVLLQHLHDESAETQNGLVSKDTSPFDFNLWNCFPPAELVVELAEGIEPPTL